MLAVHGITDDWGECRRLESTAGGEFGVESDPAPRPTGVAYSLVV